MSDRSHPNGGTGKARFVSKLNATVMSIGVSEVNVPPTRPIRSINMINPNLENVQRLFHESCIKVKEGFVLKKYSFDLPEYLQGSVLPVEAMAFEQDILILIAKKMGV